MDDQLDQKGTLLNFFSYCTLLVHIIAGKLLNYTNKLIVSFLKLLSFFFQINILDYHLLFIPVHLPHHWALGVCLAILNLIYSS